MNRTLRRALIVAGIVFSVAAVLAGVAWAIIGRFRDAASIGIIGGADGPTAVFIAGRRTPSFWSFLLYPFRLIVIAAGILYSRYTGRIRNERTGASNRSDSGQESQGN